MNLKEIEQRLLNSPLYSTDGQGIKAKIAVRFYLPFTEAEWLITEGERRGNDWELFGYCKITEWEWGYVMLNELMSIDVNRIKVLWDANLDEETTIEEYFQKTKLELC